MTILLSLWTLIGVACLVWIIVSDAEEIKRSDVLWLVPVAILAWPIGVLMWIGERYDEAAIRWENSSRRAAWNAWWDRPLRAKQAPSQGE